jgi:hypothetical protein
MDKKRFHPPLTIETGRGELRVIGSAYEAAEFLTEQWPGEKGPEVRAALVACLEALAGDTEPRAARIAVMAAARAAGIFTHDAPR